MTKSTQKPMHTPELLKQIGYMLDHPGTLGEVAAHMKRLEILNAELLEALEGLCGLAKMRPGHLHEYVAAVEQANALIAKARGVS